MDLILKRDRRNAAGIFGRITDQKGNIECFSLEHSYQQPDGSFLPKIPRGAYLCKRGSHRLENMTQPFETFEITGVPGHTNILLHTGNTNQDSSGCVLLGQNIVGNWLAQSKKAFDHIMSLQSGVDSFMLFVDPDEI